MVYGLEVRDDGTYFEIDLRKEELKSDKVYCLVNRESKSIRIWIGQRASVRQRFIAALTASKVRQEFGLDYRVRPIIQRDAYPSFLDAFKVDFGKLKGNAK
jgi:hypothetical protein